jgi:hypothetical protein
MYLPLITHLRSTRGSGLVLSFFLLSGSAVAQVPLVEFKFNEKGPFARNTGSDAISADLQKENEVSADLHTPGGTGVSGSSQDSAFSSGATAMGIAGTGGRVLQIENSPAVDSLLQFTLTGWFRTSVPMTNAARIIDNKSGADHGGFLLRATQASEGPAGGLALTVNNSSAFSEPVYTDLDEWVFFAVSYDGKTDIDNVQFYIGTTKRKVTLVNSTILAQSEVGASRSLLAIGNTPAGYDRPFAGRLDNLRVFKGVLDHTKLDSLRDLDTRPQRAP